MFVIISFTVFLRAVHAIQNCQNNICLNGGTCEVIESEKTFRCSCNQGYFGIICELACDTSCKNGGKCIASKCVCPEGFTGSTCEDEIIDCAVQGCEPGERCVQSGDSAICAIDPCSPNPCSNNANCFAAYNKTSADDESNYFCECPSGFSGEHCENDINECTSNRCLNNGICINSIGSFTCACINGFTGDHCQTSSACQGASCLNGGTCQQTEYGYKCICSPGYTSANCEKRISIHEDMTCNCPDELHECIKGQCFCADKTQKGKCDKVDNCISPNFCLNGGVCRNDTTKCVCSYGFEGVRCQHSIHCYVNGRKCVHGKCVRMLNSTECLCDEGYFGDLCENTNIIYEPCDTINCNGGECSMHNGQAVCHCTPHRTGKFCEQLQYCDENFCLNGGKCYQSSSIQESMFSCLCKEPFGGTHCEFRIHEPQCSNICSDSQICFNENGNEICKDVSIKCDECENAIGCINRNGRNDSTCICSSSWTGPKCAQRIQECNDLHCVKPQICRRKTNQLGKVSYCGCTPGLLDANCSRNTAATFLSASFVFHQFKRTFQRLPSSYELSLSFRTSSPNTKIASGENILGQIQFVLGLENGYLYVNFSTNSVNNLHKFAINDDKWYSISIVNFMKVLRVEIKYSEHTLNIVKIPIQNSTDMGIFLTRLGKGRDGGFQGCMRDVFINTEYIDLVRSKNSFGIYEGCQRTKQCSPNPCQNDGICVDNWDTFKCECKRPYLPPYCIDGMDAVTFGHENQRSLVQSDFSTDSTALQMMTDISTFIRTNKANGTIFYIGEQKFDDISTFISMALVDGLLEVKSRLGGKRIFSAKSPLKLDDNIEHYIELVRNRNNFKVFVDNKKSSEYKVENRFNHPLLADVLLIGDTSRNADGTFDQPEFFKGTIKDFRINDQIVRLNDSSLKFGGSELGTLVSFINTIDGTVSDDVCSALQPCANGRCENTFNDFKCICDAWWIGLKCDRKDHCASASCKLKSICINLDDGFICSHPATFYASSSVVYRKTGASISTNADIKFSIRTRSHYGEVLYLESNADSIRAEIIDGSLVWHIIVGTSSQTSRSNKRINDGQWHSIVTDNKLALLDETSSVSFESIRNLGDILSRPNIILMIGRGKNPDSSFTGCLKDVQIGGLPQLSFFDDKESGIYNQPAMLALQSKTNIRDDGCHSTEVCDDRNPCKNNATCSDEWNRYACKCTSGFSGESCEIKMNECETNQCKNGKCIDGIAAYSCACEPGYTGVLCEIRIDLCAEMSCLNEGTCSQNDTNKIDCVCPQGFLGSRCQTERPTNCSSSPCENGGVCSDAEGSITCKCPPGYQGQLCDQIVDHCAGNLCENGAKCVASKFGFKCLCANEYTGKLCEKQRNMCEDSPCNHGNCKEIWNDFLCECDSGWLGPKCSIDEDDCQQYPCEHNGNCSNSPGPGSFSCTCSGYYFGERCEIGGSCTNSPCGDTGICVQHSERNHSCICNKGYYGERCDRLIDYCDPSPCLNDGNCTSHIGDFECECVQGFSGDICSIDIDDCRADSCHNGGHCIDRLNGFECNCNGTGYEGNGCETDINECELGWCSFGSCTNTPGSFVCNCNAGYIGPKCNKKNPCLPNSENTTDHNCVYGKCIKPDVILGATGEETVTYECECNEGFSGIYCIHKEEYKSIPLSYIAGPIFTLLSAFCLLICVLACLLTIKSKRATQGSYSPSNQEVGGSRLPMNSLLKVPPEERLI